MKLMSFELSLMAFPKNFDTINKHSWIVSLHTLRSPYFSDSSKQNMQIIFNYM